jgi:type VI protein secretion system component VasA
VAIVASLIFVGIQLQQSAKASQIAAYQSRADAASDALVALALSEEFSALRVTLRRDGPAALNEVELDRLRSWYQGTMLRAQRSIINISKVIWIRPLLTA